MAAVAGPMPVLSSRLAARLRVMRSFMVAVLAVISSSRAVTRLGHSHDCGHVQGAVQPPVAAAVEAVSHGVPGGGGDGVDAGQA